MCLLVELKKAFRAKVSLTDTFGRMLKRDWINGVSNQVLHTDVSSFPNGVYFVNVKSDDIIVSGTINIAK